jgi:galactitol-specific phosphotransferase system IIB component
MGKNVLRKAVSMTALFSFLYLSFSGIVLYFVPQGRIAYWADWRFMGMNKEMYGDTHITISLLFLITMILHIWLNWKPIVNYMKNRSGNLVIFTKETMLGFVLSIIFVAGTLMAVAPFSTVLDAINNFKDDYEYTLGNPPYPHAELTTLAAFIARMKFDKDKVEELFKTEGIKYSMEDTLKAIGKKNGSGPAEIFSLMKTTKKMSEDVDDKPIKMYEGVQNGVDMSKYESLMGSGMGQKSVAAAAENAGITVEKALERLQKYGIKAEPNSKLKKVGTEAGVMPMDVYIIIDSGVKPQ